MVLIWIALDWLGNPNRGGFKPQGPRRGRGLAGRWQAFRQSRELSEIDVRETLRTAYGRSSLRIMWSRLDETTATAFDEARLPEVPRLVESGTVVLHRPPALDDDTVDVFEARVTSQSVPSARWRVGLDPLLPIGKNAPSARTVRSRAWKNLARTHVGALGAANRDRAARGAPPRRWNPVTARNETARLANENGEFVITWSDRGIDPFQRLETADDL